MKKNSGKSSAKRKLVLLSVGVALGLLTCVSAVTTLAYFENAAQINNSSGTAVKVGTKGNK